MRLQTLADSTYDLKKVVSASGMAVAPNIVSRAATTTAPTVGDTVDGSSNVAGAVINVAENPPSSAWQNLILFPYGGDAANETMLIRVYGWGKFGSFWLPTMLAQATCTLGNVPGVDGSAVENELFFADTIVVSTPASSDDARAVSPATDSVADVAGHLVVKTKGFRWLEILFALNSSSASNNALYGLF